MRKKINHRQRPKRYDERTLQMRKDYISCWDKGMTVAEIAKKYDLNKRTVYNHIKEIAEEAGRPVESLMSRPRHGYRDCVGNSGKHYSDHQALADYADSLPDIKGMYDEVAQHFDSLSLDAPWEEVLSLEE